MPKYRILFKRGCYWPQYKTGWFWWEVSISETWVGSTGYTRDRDAALDAIVKHMKAYARDNQYIPTEYL
jgi:hypothetical protein